MPEPKGYTGNKRVRTISGCSTSKARVRTSRAGRPFPGATVEIAQVLSDFLFGADIFNLGGHPTEGA